MSNLDQIYVQIFEFHRLQSALVCPFRISFQSRTWAPLWVRRPCFKQWEATFPVIYVCVLRDFILLSLSTFNNNLRGELWDRNISCIKIISKPKTTPHVLWIPLASAPSAFGNLILFFIHPVHSRLEYRKLTNYLALFYLITQKQTRSPSMFLGYLAELGEDKTKRVRANCSLQKPREK